jgi:transposase
MVKKKMYQRIQKLKKKGYSKTEISLKLKIDPATVRKYFVMNPAKYNAYRQKCGERNKLFSEYMDEIKLIYELNDSKRLNMAAVYDYLEEKYFELPGNEQTLRNYIHYLIKNGVIKLSGNKRCYMKVDELPYGKQLQIDFGEYTTKSKLKLYIFGAVLSASRYKYIAFQTRPFTTIDLIHHLLDCFDYIGGIPEQLVIDQDTIMVVSENAGDIVYTEKFSYFIKEMNLKMYVCRKADPESKGKIENVIKYVKYNFLQVRDFNNLGDAEESLSRWLLRRGNGKISQATKRIPVNEIEEERKHLKPLKNSIYRKDSLLGRELRLVSDKGYIMVDTNEYSVPIEYRNCEVEIYKTDEQLYVYDGIKGKQIACHKVPSLTGQKVVNRDHFRNKTVPIEELRDEIVNMHDFENWKEFIEINTKTYNRFSRDQYIIARNKFSKIEDTAIFEMAVEYCLSNKTYSMTELSDTYNYMLSEHEEEQETIRNAFMGLLNSTKPKAPHVAKRDLTEYETVISGGSK